MQQNEMGFTFAGQHTSDFGLVWVESRGHPLTPEISRNEYSIAGKDGTVLLPGAVHKNLEFVGSLFLTGYEPETQREAQQLARRIMAWLGRGRQRLTFDYDPDHFYLAQVDKATTWTLSSWFGGEIQVRFTAQPFAYSTYPDFAVMDAEGTVQIPLRVNTLSPAPLEIRIENTGTVIIDAVDVMQGSIDLRGLDLAPGSILTISMEEPIGAVIRDADGIRDAMPCAERFDFLLIENGTQVVPVGIFSSDPVVPRARITVAVRGRW